MARGFQSGAFQSSAFQSQIVAVQVGRVRRVLYDLDGDLLTREELEAKAQAVLVANQAVKQSKPARLRPQDKEYAALPNYAALRMSILAQQRDDDARRDAEQALQAAAKRAIEQREEDDVEVLMLWG